MLIDLNPDWASEFIFAAGKQSCISQDMDFELLTACHLLDA
jgi:hypothetical protein